MLDRIIVVGVIQLVFGLALGLALLTLLFFFFFVVLVRPVHWTIDDDSFAIEGSQPFASLLDLNPVVSRHGSVVDDDCLQSCLGACVEQYFHHVHSPVRGSEHQRSLTLGQLHGIQVRPMRDQHRRCLRTPGSGGQVERSLTRAGSCLNGCAGIQQLVDDRCASRAACNQQRCEAA